MELVKERQKSKRKKEKNKPPSCNVMKNSSQLDTPQDSKTIECAEIKESQGIINNDIQSIIFEDVEVNKETKIVDENEKIGDRKVKICGEKEKIGDDLISKPSIINNSSNKIITDDGMNYKETKDLLKRDEEKTVHIENEIKHEYSCDNVRKKLEIPVLKNNAAEELTKSIDSRACVYPNLKNILHQEKLDNIMTLQTQVKNFKENYLNMLYYEANNKYKEFNSQVGGVEQEYLYNLLQEYKQSRKFSIELRNKIKYSNSHIKRCKENLWYDSEQTARAKGKCADGYSVEISRLYSFKEFDKEKFNDIVLHLKRLEENVLSDAYYSYTELLTKLKIEQYLLNIINLNSTATKSTENSSLQSGSLILLKRCISIIFSFQRQPTKDKKFLEISQGWLKILVFVLNQNKDLSDNIFILNHIIRCPFGIKIWASQYVQIPWSCSSADAREIVICTCLNHILLVLYLVLNPAPDRDNFLKKLKTNSFIDPKDSKFILLDSDGEEDEEFELFKEWSDDDLVSLLSQISLIKMKDHILSQANDAAKVVDKVPEMGMIKLFAFSNAFLEVLFSGLENLNHERFPASIEFICSMIRQTVVIVSDCCKYTDKCSYEFETVCDKFLFFAVYKIFNFKNCELWPYLSILPFQTASPKLLWQILWVFHSDNVKEDVLYNERDVEVHLSETKIQDLITKLSQVSLEHQICLLETFESIVIKGNLEENFLKFIIHEIFEVILSLNHLIKESTSLFSSLIKRYPYMMTSLLEELIEREDKLIQLSVIIYEELSLNEWVPIAKDIKYISDWLLLSDLSSAINRIAQILLTKMNWEYTDEGYLFLSIKLHREVAVLVLQACLKFDSTETEWSVKRGLEQMLQYTSFINTGKENEDFLSWAWKLLFDLKLHVSDRTHRQSIQMYESLDAEDLPNPFEDPWLQPLLNGFETKHPIACYVMLVMTSVGHNLTNFIEYGLSCFSSLVEKGHYLASIQSLYYVMPVCLKISDDLLTQSQFIIAVNNLITADLNSFSSFTGKQPVVGTVLSKIESMIKHQIGEANRITIEFSLPIIKFWIKLLLKILTFPAGKTYNLKQSMPQIYYLLDIVFQLSFIHTFTRDNIMDLFYSLANPLFVTSTADQSFWNKYFGSNNMSYPILQKEILPEHPWLAWALIYAETQQKNIQNLWYLVQKEMYINDQITPSQALQKASSFLKISAPPLYCLPLYRWAKQIISTNFSHSCLPLMWQQFFMYYFQRISHESKSPRSLGNHYMKDQHLFNKLKSCLRLSIDYWWNSLQETKNQKGFQDDLSGYDENADCVFKFQVYRIFKAFSTWLNDSSLHQPTICFSALDPMYCCEKLLLLHNNDKMFWIDLISTDKMTDDLDKKIHQWTIKKIPFSSNKLKLDKKYCEENIKINEVKDLVCDINLTTSIVPFDEKVLSSEKELFTIIENNQNLIFEKSKCFTDLFDRLKQLNFDYENVLPQVYKKISRLVSVEKACLKGLKCECPASIRVNIYESICDLKVLEEIEKIEIEHHIVQNQMFKISFHQLCLASIQIENYIERLSTKVVDVPNTELSKVEQIGEALFYSELKIIDKSLPSVTSFSPSRQFFAIIIESLGKKFILDKEQQLLPLAKSIVKYQNSGELASNLFNPYVASVGILPDIYEIVRDAIKQEAYSAAFVLLSKIDIKRLLKSKEPDISVRKKMFEYICSCFLECGSNADVDNLLFYGILKKHYSILLTWMFPDLFFAATDFCIRGMEQNLVLIDIFYETICCVGCFKLNENSSLKEIGSTLKKYAENLLLPPGQQIFITSNPVDIVLVSNILNGLCEIFNQKRQHQNLYHSYKKYIKPFGLYVALLNHSLLLIMKDAYPENAHCVFDIWKLLNGSFFPWIHPIQENSYLNFPWTDEHLENARYLFEMFTVTLSNLYEIILDLSQKKNRIILSYCWRHYVDIYVKPGLRHYLISLCHTEYLNLPWKEFYPDSEDIEAMCIVLQSDLFESKEFLAKISLKIPWLELMKSLTLTQPAHCVQKILSTLGKLLIISGLDLTLTESHAHKHKIKVLEELPWNLLGLEEVESLILLYYTTYNPHTINKDDPQGSPNFYILQFLKIICCMVVSPVPNDSTFCHSKRLLYLKKFCISLSENISEIDSMLRKPDKLKEIVPSMLTDIHNIILKSVVPKEQMSYAVPLIREIFGFINSANHSDLEDHLIKSALSWIKKNKISPLLLPCLQEACHFLDRTSSIVSVAECCIEVRFDTEITDPNDAKLIWDIILASFQMQSVPQEEFTLVCVNKNAFFSLYCFILKQMLYITTSERKRLLLMNLIDWIKRADMKDVKQTEETKCLLLWDKVLELCITLLYEDDQQYVQKALSIFCKKLLVLSEDKSSDGVLGAIGFGTKSHFSVNFRFICRIISVFLLHQMPTNGSVRFESITPGLICEGSIKISSPTEPSPTSLAIHSLESLRALLKNRSYSALQELINNAIEFVINPNHSIIHSREFLKKYALLVFPNQPFLYALCQ